MSSFVYYKFKSQRAEKRIAFDGTGISVFDLKKEIILTNNFGKASEVDLLLFDSADKEYTDDNQIVPRSTSVIAKRMPASKPGRGNAALYVAGAAPTSNSQAVRQDSSKPSSSLPAAWNKSSGGAISKRFDGKEDRRSFSNASKPVNIKATPKVESVAAASEADSIKAMFEADDEVWKETQERMSHATPIYTNRGGAPRGRPFQPSPHLNRPTDSRPLPPGYICHRCSKPGHWIQDCPTNDDRDYDNRPRVKRTTGIPRSFLKAVDAPEGAAQGVMITPEGGFVIAQPDIASWEKQRSRPTPLTAADVREKRPSDLSLECPICNKLLRDAVKTPCCSKTFDEECIQTHLLESDFICPSCHKKISSLDKVTPDTASREKVRRYIADEIAKSAGGSTQIDDQDISFDAQPGASDQSGTSTSLTQQMMSMQNNSQVDGGMTLEAQLQATQSQIQHVMLMMNNPQLTPPVRLQFQMQLPGLTAQLNALQQMAMYMGGGGDNAFMGGMHIGGSMQNSAYSQGFQQGHVFNNPGLLSDAESPYQRIAVNNRRRGQKRDRPEDFVDVKESGQKQPRFYE
ncbi:DWNN-domain-containing protein [Clavulina sp. PMI_390]|nr:DWNN-domain-containing protein [Clavulina sp. PMI_390]